MIKLNNICETCKNSKICKHKESLEKIFNELESNDNIPEIITLNFECEYNKNKKAIELPLLN